MHVPGKSREKSHGASAVVRRLRRVSWWGVLVGVVVVAMVFGLEVGAVAGAVFAAVHKGIESAFGQRLRERFERQPDLRLAIADDGDLLDIVESSVLPPWPFDADRVVANEVRRLKEEAAAIESFARKGPSVLLRAADPFARRPSEEDYRKAGERFAEKLDAYEQALRAWLADYRQQADWRARMFELWFSVVSARSGAYAEDVVLTIDFPDGVDVVEDWPAVEPPPEPPSYVAPQPRSAFDLARPSYPRADLSGLASVIPDVSMPGVSFWQIRSDGRGVARRLGSVHHDSTVEFDEPLCLRVPAGGRHTLTWTLRTKNGRRHRTETLELVVPQAEKRPPFTRLHGIESFPDVPFVDNEGEAVQEARISDPPTERPRESTTDDPLDRLRDVAASGEWLALGLGDDVDDCEGHEAEPNLHVSGNTVAEDDAA